MFIWIHLLKQFELLKSNLNLMGFWGFGVTKSKEKEQKNFH